MELCQFRIHRQATAMTHGRCSSVSGRNAALQRFDPMGQKRKLYLRYSLMLFSLRQRLSDFPGAFDEELGHRAQCSIFQSHDPRLSSSRGVPRARLWAGFCAITIRKPRELVSRANRSELRFNILAIRSRFALTTESHRPCRKACLPLMRSRSRARVSR